MLISWYDSASIKSHGLGGAFDSIKSSEFNAFFDKIIVQCIHDYIGRLSAEDITSPGKGSTIFCLFIHPSSRVLFKLVR